MWLSGPCGYYPDYSLLCQDWVGETELNLRLGGEVWIADIPIGVSNVFISLKSDRDFDLRLFYGHYNHFKMGGSKQETPNSDLCFVGYGCTFAKEGTHTFTVTSHYDIQNADIQNIDRLFWRVFKVNITARVPENSKRNRRNSCDC